MAYSDVADYTIEDLPDVTGDVIGTYAVEIKPFAGLILLVTVFGFLSGSVALVVAQWRRK